MSTKGTSPGDQRATAGLAGTAGHGIDRALVAMSEPPDGFT